MRRQSARISRRVGLLAVNSRRHSVATQLPAQRSGTAKSSSCMSWDELFQENGQPHKKGLPSWSYGEQYPYVRYKMKESGPWPFPLSQNPDPVPRTSHALEPWTAQLVKDHIILRSPACDRLSRLGKCENKPEVERKQGTQLILTRAITSGDLEVHPTGIVGISKSGQHQGKTARKSAMVFGLSRWR